MDLDALERSVRRLAAFLPLLQELQERQDAPVGRVTVQLSAETSPEFKALLDQGSELFGKVETALADLDGAKTAYVDAAGKIDDALQRTDEGLASLATAQAAYAEASEKLDAFLASQAAKPAAEPEPSNVSADAAQTPATTPAA
jgi:hypothetical protein